MKRGLVDLDTGTNAVEAMARLRDCDDVVVRTEGAALSDLETLKALRTLRRARVRVVVHTFDEAKHMALGGRFHPRDIVRGIARASAAGVHVDVVLPIAESLGPIAGRLHGLAKAAPRIARFLYVAVPDTLTPSAPDAIALELDEARAVAGEIGATLEMDRDSQADTELESLLAGIKPVMRLSTETGDEVEFLERYAKFGLVGCAGDGVFIHDDGTHSRRMRLVYVAKSLERAERTRAIEAETFIRPGDQRKIPEVYRSLGIALGYPQCCVDAYVERVVLDRESEVGGTEYTEPYVAARFGWCERPSWELNHFLFQTGNAVISFTPCSYRCESAMEYAHRILECLRGTSPLARESIRRRLAVDVAVCRRGGRVQVVTDGERIIDAFPRRSPNGALVSPLDVELVRVAKGARLKSDGRLDLPETHPPIVLRFGDSR